MAYICTKPPRSCKICDHYRFDEDSGSMACFAEQDMNKIIKEETRDESMWKL